MTLQMLLKHPLYAGAYVYGRRQEDPRRRRAGQARSGRVVMAREDWLAFVPNQAPAYISWEAYERNQAQLAANRARTESRGAVRSGRALLAGLVRCGRCGPRMIVRYESARASPAYVCARHASDYGAPHCQQVPARALDAFVSRHVLTALEPAALELSLVATERLEQERAELLTLWQQRRERAAYEAERARRQYDAVEPENRLVARTLERQWEAKLVAQQQLEEAYHRFLQEQPRTLSEAERGAIRRLAADIPALWTASTTTPADRQELIRQIVDAVVVAAAGKSERVQVTIHWVGGSQTTGTIVRPIRHASDLSTYATMCEQVRTWTEERLPAASIAERLNAAGYRPARSGAFGVQAVHALRRRLQLTGIRPQARSRTELSPDEWWSADLARALGLPKGSLQHWIRRGWVRARQEPTGLRRWIVWADAAEQDGLRQLQQRSVADGIRQRWLQREEAPHGPAS
jgi:hypothetical protein